MLCFTCVQDASAWGSKKEPSYNPTWITQALSRCMKQAGPHIRLLPPWGLETGGWEMNRACGPFSLASWAEMVRAWGRKGGILFYFWFRPEVNGCLREQERRRCVAELQCLRGFLLQWHNYVICPLGDCVWNKNVACYLLALMFTY